MIKNILLAVDGSDSARRAARLARKMANGLGARLTVLTVIEPLGAVESYGLTRAKVYEVQLEGAKALLDALASELPNEMVDRVIEVGSPSETICAQAEERNADLVVLGSRGMGAVGRLLLGSVSDRVLHLCKRPVTVVH